MAGEDSLFEPQLQDLEEGVVSVSARRVDGDGGRLANNQHLPRRGVRTNEIFEILFRSKI